MSYPIQSATSAFLSAPINTWLNGVVQSPVNVGGLTYNANPMNPIFQTLLGDLYVNMGKASRAAAFLESVLPRGSEVLRDYRIISQELEPLRPTVRTVSIASRFSATEIVAQGNELSSASNAARNLIRSYFPTAHTSLQPQRNGSVEQSNPDNNHLYCLIGLPEDYTEILPGQTFFSTATYMYYVTDPASDVHGRWVITDGVANASESPTSIASVRDSTYAPKLIGGSGQVYARVPYTYEMLIFETFIPQDASDIAERRRVAIFRRLVNYVTAAVGNQITVAKNAGISPVGELISAGFGTDADTPSLTTRTTRVTGEVVLPFIPPSTLLVRGQANDGEASSPKPAFSRMPIQQEHYCMITRYGLLQTTDVVEIVNSHHRNLALGLMEKLKVENVNSPFYNLIAQAQQNLASRETLSNLIFNFKEEVGGFGRYSGPLTESAGATLLADYALLRTLPMMKFIIDEVGLNLLFGSQRLVNPSATMLSDATSGFNGVVFNPNRVTRGLNGFGVNGMPLNGGTLEGVKYSSYSRGLLRSIPVENTYEMPAGNFDYIRFGDLIQDWLANEGANSGYFLTDGVGAQQLSNYFMNYRITPNVTIDSYTGLTIREVDIAGMYLKVVVLPELTWAVNPSEIGTYTFINFGEPTNPTVRKFSSGSPFALLYNEQENGRLVQSIGARVETGLITRGLSQNAFRIRRNV